MTSSACAGDASSAAGRRSCGTAWPGARRRPRRSWAPAGWRARRWHRTYGCGWRRVQRTRIAQPALGSRGSLAEARRATHTSFGESFGDTSRCRRAAGSTPALSPYQRLPRATHRRGVMRTKRQSGLVSYNERLQWTQTRRMAPDSGCTRMRQNLLCQVRRVT